MVALIKTKKTDGSDFVTTKATFPDGAAIRSGVIVTLNDKPGSYRVAEVITNVECASRYTHAPSHTVTGVLMSPNADTQGMNGDDPFIAAHSNGRIQSQSHSMNALFGFGVDDDSADSDDDSDDSDDSEDSDDDVEEDESDDASMTPPEIVLCKIMKYDGSDYVTSKFWSNGSIEVGDAFTVDGGKHAHQVLRCSKVLSKDTFLTKYRNLPKHWASNANADVDCNTTVVGMTADEVAAFDRRHSTSTAPTATSSVAASTSVIITLTLVKQGIEEYSFSLII